MSLSKEQIENLELRLISEKAQLEAELEGSREKLDFGSDVDHMEEETDEAEETANYLGVKHVLGKKLRNIEKALDKIQKKTYGECEKCGEKIDIEVLEAEPESSYCQGCKKH